MVQVMLDLWKAKYGTSFYDIDTVTGQVYVNRDGKRIAIPEKCSFNPIVGTEIMSTTPISVRFLACNGCSAWRVLGAAKTVIRVP